MKNVFLSLMKQLTQNTKYPKTLGGLWILIVAAVVLEATACVQYFYTRNALRKDAEHRALSELRSAELQINTIASEVEMSVKAMVLMAENNLQTPDAMFDVSRQMVSVTPNMVGAGISFVENYYPAKGKWFEAYSCEVVPGDKSRIRSEQIAGPNHDYFQSEWYQHSVQTDSCIWSEPYYDNAGAKAMLVTCTCPVKNSQGELVAVAGADVSLTQLKHMADVLQVYPESFYSITSAKGMNMVPLPELAAGQKYLRYEKYIETTGWTIAVVIPDNVIYAELRRVGLIVSIMMLTGLLVLVFIIIRTAKSLVNLVNLSNRQERIESELNIARNIQMAMLPKRFPPFPDYPNLNAYGIVVPAKEVGGDLFDFHIRDNKLFFCIGDVSGKGVPASLVMVVTRSLFRGFTSYLDSPEQIMLQMNSALTGEENDQNMFVTLFLGVLDLSSGKLLYCNAGHDAPVLLSKVKSQFPVIPNLPLGVLPDFAYVEQSATLQAGDSIFLYTDGLTEAENVEHELFGKDGIMQAIESWSADQTASELIEEMQKTVASFVGNAQQSDDLTLFAIRYLAQSTTSNRHYSLVMRNDIQQIPTLAEWIESLDVPPALNMPINLALEEAVSNVMLYAYPDKSGQVLVEAEKQTERIVFTITDSGIPFDPTQQKNPDITLSVEERAIGGLGIHLVRQIMDDIRYERRDNKNILTLIKKL